ncbi:MAG: hypothetical protein ACLUOF_08545 [Ruminococcus sp.]
MCGFPPGGNCQPYEAAGANAISCLTEEHYFQGSSEYLAATGKQFPCRFAERLLTSTRYMRQLPLAQMPPC